MSVKLLIEYHLEFLRLTGCFTGSSEATLVKMLNCWKSRATAHTKFEEHKGKQCRSCKDGTMSSGSTSFMKKQDFSTVLVCCAELFFSRNLL